METELMLFEDEGFVNLLPLVFWRSVVELQISRKILLDRTAQRLGMPVSGVWVRDWLASVTAQRCGAPVNREAAAGTVLVNGRWVFNDPVTIPEAPCVGTVDTGIALIVCDADLADRLSFDVLLDPVRREAALKGVRRESVAGRLFQYPWELTGGLAAMLENDWLTRDASIESELDTRLVLENRERIHVGERTRIHPTAIIDATRGPVYVSFDVAIGPYCVIEGPAYIGPGCRIHPYTWLHGGNAIGPVCRIAGEVVGCIIHSYTNKQHAGFLGHAYVGSWVNFGAGSTNSNLKNSYGRVRVPVNGRPVDTGQQFFGAVIGDHAKIGINATIPTGAVIGLAASVAASRVAPKYIPSFGWVTEDGWHHGDPLRLLDAASAAMARRNIDMTDDEVELFLDLGTRVKSFESSPKPAA